MRLIDNREGYCYDGNPLGFQEENCIDSALLFKKVMSRPVPGSLSDTCFWLLIEVSPIHSEKVIQGLRDYLVLGISTEEVCRNRGISAGYFRGALTRLMRAQCVVKLLMEYYLSETGKTDIQKEESHSNAENISPAE